ncbi:Co2+/Mg2+ efflux protein ApaG [Flammeovirga pectinis]|uniref:Co2+/Mg2+ efflux protein ApaG n=1 Tax=Flammeovirga pectinis TaxID=2494373 RepID=A0A3Q9FQQ9_9BACT|nr:Co2+/Mg2+ efflux protein ApaG [Flammeovirga pectinis]AZQ62372.1 Co2+/Mg2+ efflux protein ApaG [Flammeovirga pectinis]
MEIAITDGIKVTVNTFFLPEYSVPAERHYVFSYQIRIENLSAYTVQLLTRNWDIIDITGTNRTVKNGNGVIGKNPVILPGDHFEYTSGCHFVSPIGKMSGSYKMQRVNDKKVFEVEIPEFTLMPSFSKN